MSEVALVATIIGAGSAAIGALIGVVGFWLRFADQIAKARAIADAAQKDASEAKTLADQAHNRISTIDHNFGLYRERVATEYVSKEAMRELKTDLVNAIDAIGAKLDMVLSYERDR